MSFNSKKLKKQLLLTLQLSLISCLIALTSAASEAQPKSYVKVYKCETAVLRDLNKDFVNIGIQNLVNNLTYPSQLNFTSTEYPGNFVDLQKIAAAGSTFSINNAYVVNSDTNTVATDPTNSSFIYFSGEFNFRNATFSNSGNLTVTLTTSEVIYIKEFAKGESGFKYAGKITLMWKDPEMGFEAAAPPQAQALVSLAFKEIFNTKIKDTIEKELNSELAKYLATQSFDAQLKFNVSQSFSSNKIAESALALNLLSVDAMVITSKFDTLLVQHYSGFLRDFSNRTDLPAEAGFDVKALDLAKLYNAVFVDKFLFESLAAQAAFKGFFIRRALKADNVPKTLKFDLDMRSIAQVVPEISNLYSLMQSVEITYAFFNPKFDFSDAKTPKVIVQLDFTVYAVTAEKQLKQVFTCQADLAFEISDPENKSPYMNFDFELIDIGNLKMSDDFSYVNTDYLKYLVKEFANFAIAQNKVQVFEKELNLSDVFEEDFEMMFFKGGVLLYNYLN